MGVDQPPGGRPPSASSCCDVGASLRALDEAGVLGPGFLTDDVGRITWVSSRFVTLTGFDAAAAVGRRRSELVSGPFVGSAGFAEFDAALRECSEINIEFPTRTASGRPYWAALEVCPLVADPEGESTRPRACVGREVDVTARRSAEDRAQRALSRAESLGLALRLEKQLLGGVLAGLPQLVWWKDGGGRYLGCNPAFLAARGLSSLADVIGRLESQLGLADDLEAQVADAEEAVLAGRAASVDVPVTLSRPDGGRSHLLVTVSSGLAPAGVPSPRSSDGLDGAGRASLIGVATDVTRLAQLERQLAHSQRLDSIGRLAAGVAHEINTPIQYVSDNTRFVLAAAREALDGLAAVEALTLARADDSGLTEELKACLSRLDLPYLQAEVPAALAQAMQGLDRVAQVVRAMTAFADPASGLVEDEINEVVHAAVQLAENRWRDVADSDLDLDPAAGRIACYPSDLRQTVLHLLVNAAQAIEDRVAQEPGFRRGRITVSTRRVDTPSGPEIHVVVGDDGVGMSAEVVQRIFDPFFTTRDVGQGSGQGLSFAHATVVAKHGGRVDVTSEPGQGTTFTVVVPDGRRTP